MARQENNTLKLSSEEAALLKKHSDFVIIPNQEGIFLLIDAKMLEKKEGTELKMTVPTLGEEKQQVIGLIKQSRLSDLVEGKFENLLNEKQRKALLELVATQRVFVFKLNETYKKGVYRVKDDETLEEKLGQKESENPLAPEKPVHEYTLEKDGFIIAHNAPLAKELSLQHEHSIKEGLLRGIKSFDGYYYLIEQKLLEHYMKKAVLALNQKEEQLIEELAKNINASKLLTRIICEFLKEDGEILEKKKGTYKYIK